MQVLKTHTLFRRRTLILLFAVLNAVPMVTIAWVWNEGSCRINNGLKQAIVSIVGAGGVTSACRSPERNRRVGGAPGSLHTQGLAIDVSLRAMTAAKAEKLRNEGYCAQYHRGNYRGGGAAHYHVVPCSTASTRQRAKDVIDGQLQRKQKRNYDDTYGWSSTTYRYQPRSYRPTRTARWDARTIWESMGMQ